MMTILLSDRAYKCKSLSKIVIIDFTTVRPRHVFSELAKLHMTVYMRSELLDFFDWLPKFQLSGRGVIMDGYSSGCKMKHKVKGPNMTQLRSSIAKVLGYNSDTDKNSPADSL